MQQLASDAIWAMVSGFARERRERRQMAFVQVFFDDSCIGQPPLYCLAGVTSNARVWADFSDAWQAALDIHPKIEYWKTSTAMFRPQDFGLTREQRNERLSILMNLLNSHDIVKFACTVDHDDFVDIWGHDKPYMFMLPLVARELGDIMADYAPAQPIDWIFDSQPEHVAEVSSCWQEYYETAPPKYKEFLKNIPRFADEKEVLPIQAADLFAWIMRRKLVSERFGGNPAPDMPDLDMRVVSHSHATRADLIGMRDFAEGVALGKMYTDLFYGPLPDREGS